MTTTSTEAPATVDVPVSSLRDALTAAHLAIDTARTLPVLGMVQIVKTADRLLFRSTNRYHMLEATVPLEGASADDWEAVIDSPDVKQILAALPKKTLTVASIGPDDEMAFNVAIQDGASLRLRLQDADFPKLANLFPDETEAIEAIRLNTKLLAVLCKMPGQGVGYVRFKFAGGKPVLVEWADDNTQVSYRYLLMPVRDGS